MLNKKQIIEFISEQLDVNKDACTPTANFINDLGADSLDLIEMVMELEEQAHISISDEELNDLNIKTIGDVFSFLESKGLLVE